MTEPRYLQFRLSANTRTLRDWMRERRDSADPVWAAVKRYARTHGCAAVWRADDSLRLFYMDKGKLRQKTWRHARPIEA